MTGTAVEIDVDDHGLIVMFQDITYRTMDLRPVWPAFADRFAAQEAAIFGSQGSAAGVPWAPLSAPYAAWKAKVRPGTQILEFDGDLIDSLTNTPLGVEQFHEDYAEVGTDDHTAAFHQYGTRNMPARPPVHATDVLAFETASMLGDWIIEGRVPV